MEEQELANQLRTYADTIAAFSILQTVAFCYAVEKGDSMTCVAIRQIVMVCCMNGAATTAYTLGVLGCYFGENRLVPRHTLSANVRFVQRWLRTVRIIIIVTAGLFAIATMFIVKSQYAETSCPSVVTPFQQRE